MNLISLLKLPLALSRNIWGHWSLTSIQNGILLALSQIEIKEEVSMGGYPTKTKFGKLLFWILQLFLYYINKSMNQESDK